jgi:CoA:oxalate CoA-transferase
MSKPLEGIKVIEIAQEIQGPFAGLFLSDLGAEITKVENRETGDLSRWLLAQLIGGPDVKNGAVSHYFTAMNRGKRSITVDLKKPEGIEIVRRLAKVHDVILTNYRPGVLDRLGLGYEELRKINPRIIFAQASSWGPKGPWRMRPSRDTLAQAASGLMSKTGMPTDPPLAAGAAIADQAGALTLAGGVLAALFARERTGEGQRVDASIYGTMIAAQGFELTTRRSPAPNRIAPVVGIRSCMAYGAVSAPRTDLYASRAWTISVGRVSARSWNRECAERSRM